MAIVSAKRLACFNGRLMPPSSILPISPTCAKKLALDQHEAAELFGVVVNAFSRYETGKTKPPLALVKLLKLLDHHPELLGEIKAA